MVVGGDLGGELGFLQSAVDNLMSVAHPAAGWVVGLTGI